MDIKIEIKDGPPITGVVTICGYVETPQARQLRKTLAEIEEKGVGRIIFDMSDVPFVSSTGLSLLVSYSNTKRADWGENPVVLAGLQLSVMKSMQVLGILGLFAVSRDIKTALEEYGIT